MAVLENELGNLFRVTNLFVLHALVCSVYYCKGSFIYYVITLVGEKGFAKV